MAYFLKDTNSEGYYFKGLEVVPENPDFAAIFTTTDEEEAFDFEDEGVGSVALSILNAGGSRFIGHRPPKPQGH